MLTLFMQQGALLDEVLQAIDIVHAIRAALRPYMHSLRA